MKALFLKLPFAGLALLALTLSAQPVITMQPTNQLVFGGSNVTFNVAVSGTEPFNLPRAVEWN